MARNPNAYPRLRAHQAAGILVTYETKPGRNRSWANETEPLEKTPHWWWCELSRCEHLYLAAED